MAYQWEPVVHAMIAEDWAFAKTCLITLYQKQEQEEKQEKAALHHNGVGFNKGDALSLTTWAEVAIRGGEILPHEKKSIQQRLEKYSTQLACYEEIILLLR